MMEGEERLIVRLPSDYITLLAELVHQHKYANEAAAVTDAVRTLLESSFTEEERSVVLQRANVFSNLDLNDFTSDDTDANEVLGNVIRRGLDSDRE